MDEKVETFLGIPIVINESISPQALVLMSPQYDFKGALDVQKTATASAIMRNVKPAEAE